MNTNTRKVYLRHSILAAVLTAIPVMPSVLAQTVGPPQGPAAALQGILRAHRAWTTPPASVQITGTLTRDKMTEPVKITATRQEEALVESGTAKRVATTSVHFEDKQGKVTPLPTLSGFTQLDATSLFFLAQMAARPVTVAPAVPAVTPGGPGQRIRVRSNRTEMHYGKIGVADEVDLYVGPGGLLTGLSRSFYESAPRFKFSHAYAFSDYKETNGILLPYRIERYLKGRNVETIVVTSYEFDVPAAPTLFSPGGRR